MEDKWIFLKDELFSILPDGTELHYVEMTGPSSVTKPTTTESGAALCGFSLAFEQDTGKVCNFQPGTGWRDLFTFGA